jgi:hypothetical protein
MNLLRELISFGVSPSLALEAAKPQLSRTDKEYILDDLEAWAGELAPAQLDDEQLKDYVDNVLDVKYDGALVLTWLKSALRHTGGDEVFTATDVHYNPKDVSVLVVSGDSDMPGYRGVNVVFYKSGKVQLVTADKKADGQAKEHRAKIVAAAKKALGKEELAHLGVKSVRELREAVETVELTDLENALTGEFSNEIPSAAWPKGVMYRGHNVFDVVYKNRPAELNRAEEQLKDDPDYRSVDFQEVYLGYDPVKDVFIQGYDGWVTEEDEDTGDEDDTNSSPYIIFQLSPQGKVKVIRKGMDMGKGDATWYNTGTRAGPDHGGYRAAHRKFPKLIDIRLD